ncbi:MAG: N-acetylmuramoyl-L-alanine amidase [Bacteroidota bacterium]
MKYWQQKWPLWLVIFVIFGGASACKPKPSPRNSTKDTPVVVEENTFQLPNEDRASLKDLVQPSTQYLVRDSSLFDYFKIDETGIYFFADPKANSPLEAEFVIFPDEFATTMKMFRHFPLDSMVAFCREKKRSAWPDRFKKLPLPARFYYKEGKIAPLSGLKVAIDPGHMAATAEVAEIEGKYMKMYANAQQGRPAIQFHEANLTLATAHLIRQQLEAMGATVLMTRTQPGVGVTGLTWEAWRGSTALEDSIKRLRKTGEISWKRARWWRKTAEEKDIMKRFYTPMDLRARAKMINEFQPHLTLIIHYNVDSPNWELRDDEGYFRPTDQNYLMAFTPGSFMNGELAKLEDRVAFLRQIISDDVAESIRLCDAFVKASVAETGVHIVSSAYPLSYLHRASILTDKPGVYARNLSLTRLIAGPLCYGESLNQDHREESLALNRRDLQIEGINTSSRLKSVANAYVKAVLSFVKD